MLQIQIFCSYIVCYRLSVLDLAFWDYFCVIVYLCMCAFYGRPM